MIIGELKDTVKRPVDVIEAIDAVILSLVFVLVSSFTKVDDLLDLKWVMLKSVVKFVRVVSLLEVLFDETLVALLVALLLRLLFELLVELLEGAGEI